MGDHVPDGSDECAADPVLTPTDRRRRCGSRGVRPVDEGSEGLVGGVLVPPDDVSADHTALGRVGRVGRVVGAVEGEVAEGGEPGLDPVQSELLVGV
jgi:hypothetical protein